MSIEFTRWPDSFEHRYRDLGYWQDKPLTDILQTSCKREPNAIAIICGDRHFTYSELDHLSNKLAQTLCMAGLKPYDTALVQLPNIAEFYIVFFALLKIGVVPVNALYSHQHFELMAYTQQVHPSVIIADKSHPLFSSEDFVNELKKTEPLLRSIFILGDVQYAESLIDAMHVVEEDCEFEPTPAGEVAFFQLSGGSTGTPKLIPRTHNDYLYSVRRSAEVCCLNATTRFLCALPAAHNFTLSSPGALGVLDCGGTVIMAPSPEPLSCFTLVRKHEVNTVALVPPAVSLWLSALPGHADKIKTLKLLQVGGASFSEAAARRATADLNCQIQQVFGMAEGLVNYTRLDDDDNLIFSTQGSPMCPDDEVRVIGGDANPVPVGVTGMLLTRGPYTIRGYYNCKEYNLKAFDDDGFYYTGDLVQVNEQGYMRVVGRVKDQINRGGEKISAEEVEGLLMRHPSIVHVALVSMPDPLIGEKSCAFVHVKDSSLRPVKLRNYLRSQGVAQYKLPDHFVFTDKFPLTPVGKVDKKLLRQQLQDKDIISKV